MKRMPIIILVLIATACFALGQRVSTGTADEESLKQLVQDWADAVVRGDVEKLEKMEADDFRGGSEGIQFDKKKLRDALSKGSMKVGSWTVEDVRVSIRGNSAMVTGRSTLTNATYMNADFSGGWEWTDRFVKQKDGNWRAVSSQSKRISR